jgi:hypothetical protein
VSVLSLAELRDHARAISSALSRLEEPWRIGSPNAYERPRHGGQGSGGRATSRPCRRCKGYGDLSERDDRGTVVKQGSLCPDCHGAGSIDVTDDPVSETYLATERLREAFNEASEEIRDARVRVDHALQLANDALHNLEPPPTVELAEAQLRAGKQGQLERLRTRTYQKLRQNRNRDESETGGVRPSERS